jgi:3-deoxy-7-phosphoheptulonate synthase
MYTPYHHAPWHNSGVILVMRRGAPKADLDAVLRALDELNVKRHVFHGKERVVITSLSEITPPPEVLAALEILPGVDRVTPLTSPYRLASREGHPEPSVVQVGGVAFGRDRFTIVAGPAHVTDPVRLRAVAEAVAPNGAAILRVGGDGASLSERELEWLTPAALPVMAEVGEPADVLQVAAMADLLHVAAHNMQNRPLLRAVGRARRPVLVERGLSATVEEWLGAAEQVLSAGNFDVVLCERGIRTYEADRQATLDLSAIPVLKRLSHLPVVVDVSQGTGHRYLIRPMALAAAAAGADGLVVEVHDAGVSDLMEGPGSLTLGEFADLTAALRPLLGALGRTLS